MARRVAQTSRREARTAMRLGAFALAFVCDGPFGSVVHAAPSTLSALAFLPFEGTGSADVDAKTGPSKARTTALSRARKAALEAALATVPGPLDADAKKAVLKGSDAWTGSYRVLEQKDDGAKVTVRVEVDVDAVRLGKRVAKKKGKTEAPRFALGEITAGDACQDASRDFIASELAALGAVADAGTQPLAVALTCSDLGAVRYTHVHATAVQAVASSTTGALANARVHGFAADGPEATRTGVRLALEDVATRLSAQATGGITIRVESPLPAARVRRFEQALRNSVVGVDEVSVVGIEPGVVRIGVAGEVTLRVLAERLGALSVPGFSLTIVGVSEPDVITVRFR